MTARLSAMQRLKFEPYRGTKWNCPGREWMRTSSVALAGRHRKKSSGKAISHTLSGGAAVACLVIGCGWTVYSNIINASAYPTIGNADHVEAVVRGPKVAERSNVQVIHETFAALAEQRPLVASITQDMFNERVSAALPMPSPPTPRARPPLRRLPKRRSPSRRRSLPKRRRPRKPRPRSSR